MFRFGWTVSLQYLITIWMDLAKDNRVLSFIKVSVKFSTKYLGVLHVGRILIILGLFRIRI